MIANAVLVLVSIFSHNTSNASETMTDAFIPICERQDSVRIAFEKAYSKNCKALTKEYLESNNASNNFIVQNASSLNPNDFKWLKLGFHKSIRIQNNDSLTTLEPGLFNNLTVGYKGHIYIQNNDSLSTLERGLFENINAGYGGSIKIYTNKVLRLSPRQALNISPASLTLNYIPPSELIFNTSNT